MFDFAALPAIRVERAAPEERERKKREWISLLGCVTLRIVFTLRNGTENWDASLRDFVYALFQYKA